MRSFAFIERMPVVDLSAAISQMAVLLIVVVVGIIATKLGYLDEGVRAKLSQVINNITLPCMIVASAGALDASALGGLTAPLAMMMVGVIVANSRLADVMSEWRIYPFIALRHFLLPLGVHYALAPFVSDTVILGIAVVMLAMPVGSLAPMFAGMYGHDAKLTAKGTILSTIASFALIPILVALVLS